MPQAFRRPAAIGNIHMPARQNAAKKGFNLTPKHLLLAAFMVVALAVAALVVGVFRTMSAPVETAAAPPESSRGNTVEILSPRGASGVAVPAGQVLLPGQVAAPPAETAAADGRTQPAAANTETPAAAVKPASPAPAKPAAATAATTTAPATPAAAPEKPAPTPAPATTPAPAKPAAKPAKPKDVMDNLF